MAFSVPNPLSAEATSAVARTLMEKRTFVFHNDAGHGWLAVTSSDLLWFRLSGDNFSRFSYHSGDDWYLEEDCDAEKFTAKYEAMYGHAPDIRHEHHHGSCFIRKLARNT